jgi:hypothetical protein
MRNEPLDVEDVGKKEDISRKSVSLLIVLPTTEETGGGKEDGGCGKNRLNL